MRCLFAGVLVLVVAFGSGCSGNLESSVHGLVTLDGKPLERGNVAFHPVESGALAYGSIKQDGTYELRTGGSDGLAPGDYRVTVVSNEPPVTSTPDRPPVPGKLITPDHYASVDTTDLTATINPGHNKINLRLVSGKSP